MIHIYALPIHVVILILIIFAFLWALILKSFPRNILCISAALILIPSLWGIIRYSVAGRTVSDQHVFTFFADISNEFFREMVMNAFLYYPLGLALSVLIGLWSIPLAFMFSVGIETWQYFAGTGLAQGTDVICNTLGCAIGALPFFISKRINRK